jgi:membrane fusion protein (multidrug efflux system)
MRGEIGGWVPYPTLLTRVLGGVTGIAAASTLLWGCGGDSPPDGGGGPPPVSVQIVTAAAGELPRTLSAVGSLKSPETTTVASEVSGTVVALDIPEGRYVAAGHLLARIDDAEARAALSVARARLTNAKARLARLRSLRESKVSSEQALEDAVAEFDAARGVVDESGTRLRKTKVRAPFAGILGLRQVNQGKYLESGDPIVEITQVDPLELEFGLPQRYARDLALDQVVLGTVGQCGQRFTGRVDAINPRVDPGTRAVRLQAIIPNSDGTLLPGMAVRVRLVIDTIPDAIVIPQEAIVRQGTKHLVYVLDDEDRARQREVTLGTFFVDGVHLPAGLEPGERVVVAGHQKLRPGASTRLEPYVPTQNPNLELGWLGPDADCRAEP